MEATKPAVSALLLLISGCRPQVTAPDSALHDMASADSDGGSDEGDLAGADLVVLPDLECPSNASEICGNACDDDRNGYTDDDDPACTPQVLATWQGGWPQLERLTLLPPYARGFLDGNMVLPGARGVYRRAFAPGVAFVINEGAAMMLLRITLPQTMTAGMVEPIMLGYGPRDVCIFNGELILIEPGMRRLHRLKADGTELGTVQLPAWTALNTHLTACSSDGKYLYIAEHFGAAQSQFETIDTAFMPVGTPVTIDPLLALGLDRCLDFAWTSSGFHGLWVNSLGSINDDLPADELRAFAFDGGIGAAIDAGQLLHGMGEFVP